MIIVFMDIVLGILLFILGASVGSFLNVVIDRLPAGQSIIYPPSHCPACSRRLEPLDLVPIISFIALRGRCRYCGARIPSRLLVIEMICGLAFLGTGLLLLHVFKWWT